MTLRRAILWLPALLPAYLLRFKIGPLPTTALEIILLALILIVTVYDRTLWIEGWRAIRTWRVVCGAWFIVTALAIFVAPDHIAALGLWRAYILEPLVYFVLLAACLKTEKDRQQVEYALIASAVFVSAWALFQFVTNIGIPHPWGTLDWTVRRATGPFPYPNALALYCAPIAALCVGLFMSARKGEATPRPYILGFISAFVGTLLAKSAGGVGAVLICLLIAGLAKKTMRKWTLIACIVAITITVITPQIRTPLVKLVTFSGWSGQVRQWMWKDTWRMIKDRPLQGAGLGAYPTVFAPYHSKANAIEIFQYPHNILLNFWSETGLLGVVAFGWICVIWVRVASGYKPTRLLTYLPLLAILIHGLVDVPYFKNDLAVLFWVLAAVATLQSTLSSRATRDI